MENKRGRPTLSEDEQTVRLSAKVPQSVKDKIEEIGNGNISLGVRLLIKFGHTVLWSDRESVPNIPAVYMIFGSDGSLLYIGQTIALSQRLRTHSRSKQFEAAGGIIRWFDVPENLLLTIESELIHRLDPELNGTPTPEPAKKQLNIRVSEKTREKIDSLTELYGTQTEVVSIAVDRLHQDDVVNVLHCPECGSTEIREKWYFDRGLCESIGLATCADCGTEWEL